MLDVLKSNKLLLIIIGVLIALMVACLMAYLSMQSHKNIAPKAPPATVQQDKIISDEELAKIVPPEVEQTSDFATLVDETLLEQPVAEDPSLLKDELVQLQDIQTQLNDQKSMLEQQHQDADKLLELKEKQLAALEKQLSTAQ